MKKFSIVLCALALLAFSCALFTPQAAAQAVFGSIFGTVTDPSGAAVPGVKVVVTSATKGTSQETTTNADGNYSVTHLIPDVYNVRAEGAGFKAFEAKNIVVSADAAARVDGQFQVGGSTETVEVTAEAPQLKTDRADVATIFNEKAVEDLPLFNRNFTALVLASPGSQQLGWSHASSENPQGSLQTKVNGQTFAGTGFMLDGTDNRDPILGIIVINPTLESVTEAKMTSQNYEAEFGQAVAGVVASQTRSGSNSLHGSGFGFRRSDATQARDPFAQRTPDPVTGRLIPPSLYGQFGGSVGGPIIKDKLFFFGDYQGTRSKIGSSYRQSVPTDLVRSTCGSATSLICDLSEYVAASPGNVIYDPTTGVQGGANNGKIARSSMTPIAQQPARRLELVSITAVCPRKLWPCSTSFPRPTHPASWTISVRAEMGFSITTSSTLASIFRLHLSFTLSAATALPTTASSVPRSLVTSVESALARAGLADSLRAGTRVLPVVSTML